MPYVEDEETGVVVFESRAIVRCECWFRAFRDLGCFFDLLGVPCVLHLWIAVAWAFSGLRYRFLRLCHFYQLYGLRRLLHLYPLCRLRHLRHLHQLLSFTPYVI